MKKSIALLLSAVLLLAVFQLLGQGGISSADRQEVEALRVCVTVPSEFGDKSLNDATKAGVEQIKEEFNIKLSTIECKNENYKQHLMTAAESNDIVIAVGWEFSDLKRVAEEYLNTKFIWVDNVVDAVEGSPNVLCLTYKQDEGAFAAGYIAARLSQTNTIAAVAAEKDSAIVRDFVSTFEQGARYANGGIRFYESYTDSYDDPLKGEECAKELHAKGADVIVQLAGDAGSGVLKAAKSEGFTVMGTDSDLKLAMPQYDSVIACSVKKDVAASVYDTLKEYIASEDWNGGRKLVLGAQDGYVSLAYGDEDSVELVDEATRSDAEQVLKAVASGKLTIESAE